MGCPKLIPPCSFGASPIVHTQLAHQAGIPEGVFNVITTSSECTSDVVKTLCTHPTVRMISFTGSTAVGKVSCCMYKLLCYDVRISYPVMKHHITWMWCGVFIVPGCSQ